MFSVTRPCPHPSTLPTVAIENEKTIFHTMLANTPLSTPSNEHAHGMGCVSAATPPPSASISDPRPRERTVFRKDHHPALPRDVTLHKTLVSHSVSDSFLIQMREPAWRLIRCVREARCCLLASGSIVVSRNMTCNNDHSFMRLAI